MARERAYRHDIRCRPCGSNWLPKAGLCVASSPTVAASASTDSLSKAIAATIPRQSKAQAIAMHTVSMGYYAISRVLGASLRPIHSWIYVGVRRGDARNWRWIWMAMIEDALRQSVEGLCGEIQE